MAPLPLPPDPIHRREALRRAALLLGGAISGPTLAAVLAGCDAHAHPAPAGAGGASTAAHAAPPLDAEQAELIATIAEQIIPETETPGARSAGVPRFIATMLAEYYTPAERARFLAGLADVDRRARAQNGRPFLRCTPPQQHAIVLALDGETFAPAAHPVAAVGDAARETERGGAGGPNVGAPPAAPRSHAPPSFFRTMKELTVIGYYTSEPGATKELRYVQVPGRFDGCVPLATVGRAWAV